MTMTQTGSLPLTCKSWMHNNGSKKQMACALDTRPFCKQWTIFPYIPKNSVCHNMMALGHQHHHYCSLARIETRQCMLPPLVTPATHTGLAKYKKHNYRNWFLDKMTALQLQRLHITEMAWQLWIRYGRERRHSRHILRYYLSTCLDREMSVTTISNPPLPIVDLLGRQPPSILN